MPKRKPDAGLAVALQAMFVIRRNPRSLPTPPLSLRRNRPSPMRPP